MGADGMTGTCIQCGLPLTGSRSGSHRQPRFCCHACRLVSRIVGPGQEQEQAWGLLRLGCGVVLAMNVMMISLLMYAGSIEPPALPVFRVVLLVLAALAMLILMPPFLSGALREMQEGRPSLDVLIALGALAAFLVSAANTVRGRGAVFFDTATMLPVLVTLGRLVESTARGRAGDLLHSLEKLLPDKALLVSPLSGEVPVDRLRPGDRIRIRPGERVAVDGRILEGETMIVEAPFTGESGPRHCSVGDRVMAGTVNGAGTLVVEAERTGADLLLQGIVRMIAEAWQHPSRAERLAGRLAERFVPVVVGCSLTAAAGWWLAGDPARGWLSALSVLVVACPCTMGIATPLATSLAIGRAAREGIVVRGGQVMELIGEADLFFFDKTGTITTGCPTVIEVTVQGVGEAELLGRLATLEQASGHVLAAAVVAEAARRGIAIGTAEGVESVAGAGICGNVTWNGRTTHVRAGSPPFVSAAPPAGALPLASVIDVAWDGTPRGRLLLGDPVRDDAQRSVERLRNRGIECALLSGDSQQAAREMARQAGIARVEAPVSPGRKLAAVQQETAGGRIVAMVGDGVNDAPALAAAHAGIAFGAGMELPRQAGNVVILSHRLGQIPWLVELSRRTGSVVRRNFAWSFGYNGIALAAAMAGLLHPLLSAVAMVCSSLTVLANSLTIMRFPSDTPDDR